MKYLISKERSFFVVVITIFMTLNVFSENDIIHSELLVSTSAGLDISTVHLLVKTDYEYHERLYDLVIEKFKKAGLILNESNSFNQGEPLLEITLNSEPLKKSCTETYLYWKNLKLFETVQTIRTPTAKVWTVTWARGVPDPIPIDSKPTLEKIEDDLDEMIDNFIMDYKFANQLPN